MFETLDTKELMEIMHQMDLDRLGVVFKDEDTMKLFLCRKCKDVVRCFYKERTCKCGESSGKYLENGVEAIFRGKNCVPLGMDNNAIAKAVQMADIENKHQKTPTTCSGVDFKTFVILDCSTTILKR